MFYIWVMDELSRKLEKEIKESLRSDDIDCSSCGSDSLEVEVWGVSENEPRAAAICKECGARLNIRVSREDIEKVRRG